MKKTFLLFGSSIFALLMGEATLRFAGFSYPNFYHCDWHTGAVLKPKSEGWWRWEGEAYIRINSHGMRDDREPVVPKPADVFRIVVLGDSYVEAIQVDVSATFWRILESELQRCAYAGGKRIEVLNFGVSGYSTAQELITLRERVKPFQPDLVLLAFLSGNDVRDNSRAIAGAYPRPYFFIQNGHLVADNSFREHWIFRLKASWAWNALQTASDYSRVIQLFNRAKNVLAQPLSAPQTENRGKTEVVLEDHIYLSSPPDEWEEAWQITEALILAIREESARQGARFLLVTLTNGIQVTPDAAAASAYAKRLGEKDLFYPEKRMRALAEREGLDAVFLAETAAQYARSNRVYLHGFQNAVLGDGHWNEAGHRFAAEQIACHLCANSDLPARTSKE